MLETHRTPDTGNACFQTSRLVWPGDPDLVSYTADAQSRLKPYSSRPQSETARSAVLVFVAERKLDQPESFPAERTLSGRFDSWRDVVSDE